MQPKIAILKNGCRLMLLVSSNGYEDRDEEFVHTEALDRYVDKHWIGDVFVEDNALLFWHDDEESPIGRIVWADMEGTFLIEVAIELPKGSIVRLTEGARYWEILLSPTWKRILRWDDQGCYALVSDIWDYIEQNPDEWEWGASQGFHYMPEEEGDYKLIEKFETSVLPRCYAANPYTFAGVLHDQK